MVRAAGVHAQTPNGFALARELRESRQRAGLARVIDVGKTLAIPRRLIDGLELGDYDVAVDRKHLTKWSRPGLLRLLIAYRTQPLAASAHMQLALLARVFREDESDDPVDAFEWREAGGTTWRAGLDLSRQRAEREVAAILRRYRSAWDHSGRVPAEAAIRAEGVARAGVQHGPDLSEMSPAALDTLDFLAHATVGTVPVRLLERAGVAGGDLQAAVAELGGRALISVGDVQGSQLITLETQRDQIASAIGTAMSRWRVQSWAWRTGLRYLQIAIKDETQRQTALPLGDLRNYLGWLRSAIETGEIPGALVAWSKLVRYLWEIGNRDLFEEAENLGARALDQFNKFAPNGQRLLRGLHMAEMAYLQLERGHLAEAAQLATDSLGLFESIGDVAGQAIAHRYLGLINYRLESRTNLETARAEYRSALASIRKVKTHGLDSGTLALAINELRSADVFSALVVGYRIYAAETRPAEAEVHNLIASVEMKAGRLSIAIRHATRSIELYRSAADRWPGSEAAPLITRGRCRQFRGQRRGARADLRNAIRVAHGAKRDDLARGARIRLAEVEASTGRYERALRELEEAERLGLEAGSESDRLRIGQLRTTVVTKLQGK